MYASTQRAFAIETLGIEPSRLRLIAFHADDRFFKPGDSTASPGDGIRQICSAGLEWRDYPTLIDAVAPLENLRVRLAAASPWSKHANETEKRELPAHVTARRYEYDELRGLYAESDLVVVPLYENDFQAGVTTLLEGMAMGKAVIVTKTTGQTDVVEDGVNGLCVPPGDAAALRCAIERLLGDDALRSRLAGAGKAWIENNATLDRWTAAIANAIVGDAAAVAKPDLQLANAG